METIVDENDGQNEKMVDGNDSKNRNDNGWKQWWMKTMMDRMKRWWIKTMMDGNYDEQERRQIETMVDKNDDGQKQWWIKMMVDHLNFRL